FADPPSLSPPGTLPAVCSPDHNRSWFHSRIPDESHPAPQPHIFLLCRPSPERTFPEQHGFSPGEKRLFQGRPPPFYAHDAPADNGSYPVKPSKDTKGWYFAPALRRARSVRHRSVLSGYEARNFGSALPSSCGNSGHIHPPPAAARPGAADLKNTDDCRGPHPPAAAPRIDGRYPQSASHHSKCRSRKG